MDAGPGARQGKDYVSLMLSKVSLNIYRTQALIKTKADTTCFDVSAFVFIAQSCDGFQKQNKCCSRIIFYLPFILRMINFSSSTRKNTDNPAARG